MFNSSIQHSSKLTSIASLATQNDYGNLAIEECLGHGTYGIVFRALQNGNPVAVKIYHHKPIVAIENQADKEFRRNVRVRLDFPDLHEFLQDSVMTVQLPPFGRSLVSDLVVNFDGSVARPLSTVKSTPRSFFDILEHILSSFAERPVLCRTGPSNILVKWISDTEAVPVLIDFQSYQDYTHHPTLLLKHLTSSAKRSDMHKWRRRMLQSITEFPESWGDNKSMEKIPRLATT